MIDITKAKADAEEGLRIAERAAEGPWLHVHGRCLVCSSKPNHVADLNADTQDANGPFIADSRTRAPEAYRNVIALCEENERLRLLVESWQSVAKTHEGLSVAKDIDIAELRTLRAEERFRVGSLISAIWDAAKRAGIANDVPPDGPNAIGLCQLMGERFEEMQREIDTLRDAVHHERSR